MGRPIGYEYSYEFCGEDEIIPLYPNQVMVIRKSKWVLFEIRTHFNIRVDGGVQKKLGSERFAVSVRQDEDEWLEDELSFRLKDDYWMSEDEIQSLVRDAFDFVKQKAIREKDEEYSSVIAVVVKLDVSTVQQDGEPIRAVYDRAIHPQRLIPIYVWPLVPRSITQFDESSYLSRKSLMWELQRVRVEDDSGAGSGLACPVCSLGFKIGDQVSFLPDCNHACHSHCVFTLLGKRSVSCPLCHVRIPTDMERLMQSGGPENVSHLESGV